jgi:hypothetical protein
MIRKICTNMGIAWGHGAVRKINTDAGYLASMAGLLDINGV